MRRLVLFSLLLCAWWVSAAQAFGAVPLRDPPPVPIPEKVDERDVAKFVVQTLSSRAWGITREEPGLVVATMRRDAFMVRIKVTWDAHAIRITHIENENLDYEVRDGQPYIHRSYPRWVDDLVFGFQVKMRVRSIENGGSGT